LALGSERKFVETIAHHEAALRIDPGNQQVRKNLEKIMAFQARAEAWRTPAPSSPSRER